MRTKVMLVFGTRPEAIKMAPVLKALREQDDRFEPVVCVTGQHREMLDQVLELFGIEPDHDLAVMSANQTLGQMTSRVLSGLDPVLERENPDWVLVQGDTTTAMAASLAAFYRRIPVGHVEAGLRTDDKYQPFPEEINRRITSVIADLHFAPTDWAAANLRREGIPEERIVVTGNTVIDAIKDVAARPFDPTGVPARVSPCWQAAHLVTAHRRENFGRGIEQICDALQEIVRRHDDVHVVYPVISIRRSRTRLCTSRRRPSHHPPAAARLPAAGVADEAEPFRHHGFRRYPGGGARTREAGLVLRNTTERPEGVHAGTVRLVGTQPEPIIEAVDLLMSDREAYRAMATSTNPYGDGHAAERIVDHMARCR